MAEATYFQDHEVHQGVTAGAVASGEILQLADGRAAVYTGLNAAAANDTIGKRVAGIFKVASASGTTFAIGAEVWWDASASLAVASSKLLDGGADFYLGTAAKAKVSGETVVEVDLNAGWQRLRPFVYEFDAGDTDQTVRTLIPASMNPNGLRILSIHAFVTEVFAGASEDQGVVTVKDNEGSPNTLATLTAANGGADAVDDVIQGASEANAILSASGVATKKVAAGKAVTGQLTQLCSGAGAAGKLEVHIIAESLL